jgi:hypothetical protein
MWTMLCGPVVAFALLLAGYPTAAIIVLPICAVFTLSSALMDHNDKEDTA